MKLGGALKQIESFLAQLIERKQEFYVKIKQNNRLCSLNYKLSYCVEVLLLFTESLHLAEV